MESPWPVFQRGVSPRGPKELWVVPEASHTGGLGVRPAEFKRRVLQFYKRYDSIKARVQ